MLQRCKIFQKCGGRLIEGEIFRTKITKKIWMFDVKKKQLKSRYEYWFLQDLATKSTTIYVKIVGTKLRRLRNVITAPAPLVQCWCWSKLTGPLKLRQGWGEWIMHCRKASALQTPKGEFQCIKINKISALQRRDFQILFQLTLSNSKIVVL